MGLKEINEADRIIFFNRFTKEILGNLARKYKISENIESEKIKIKFSEQSPAHEVLRTMISGNAQEIKQEIKEIQEDRRPTIHRKVIIEKPMIVTKQIIKQKMPQIINKIPPKMNMQDNKIFPGSGLKKIDHLMKDPTIQSIECSGPGKNILIKRFNQINITKTVLSESEIKEVIEDYSNQARIPLVGGILKAAVGNSVISAVVSEFVGSRFIINKLTPYSLLNK